MKGQAIGRNDENGRGRFDLAISAVQSFVWAWFLRFLCAVVQIHAVGDVNRCDDVLPDLGKRSGLRRVRAVLGGGQKWVLSRDLTRDILINRHVTWLC